MTRRPLRFIGPRQVPLAATTVYTVPANKRAILRHIHIYNPITTAVQLTIAIGDVTVAANRIFDAFNVVAQASMDHYCYYVLEAGETIQTTTNNDLKLTLTVVGDELT